MKSMCSEEVGYCAPPKFVSPVAHALDAYQLAKAALVAQVKKAFPVGSWARVCGTQVVGKVHAYCEDREYIHLLLEHGDTRVKPVGELERCEEPYWAKHLSPRT